MHNTVSNIIQSRKKARCSFITVSAIEKNIELLVPVSVIIILIKTAHASKAIKNAVEFQQSYEKLPSLLINYFVTIKIISLKLKTTQNYLSL